MHIVHLLTVILWIGGLGFVTILIFPLLTRTSDPLEKVLLFQRIEHRFAPLAKVYNVVVGVSGFTMLFLMGWHRHLLSPGGVPLLFMILVWFFWAVMLFGLEPLVIKKLLDRMEKNTEEMDIDGVFGMVNRVHWVLLVISLAAAAAGAVFVHGPRIF